MDCPSEESVLDYVEGRLDAKARADLQAHADGCGECRALLADLARSLVAGDEAGGAPPHGLLRAGASVGRFRIDGIVGAGGMGVVYAAHDPDLDRRVALKLVRRDPISSTQRLRLLREAQAAARVAHPNVVTVHEVGTFDGQVFIAMELVDGSTLSAWLREQKPAWPSILRVLIDAGRGLAAAHALGLVHRDFKPDNLLVGRDGRSRVTDFGLARPLASESSVDGSKRSLPAGRVTVTGAVIGTPAYMAPEQMRGEPADQRADCFSFCVTAYEALYGQRPYAGKTLAELQLASASGRIEPPLRRDAPPSLRRALVRGLAVDPAQRPSLAPLLTELEHSLRGKRHALWLAGAVLVLLAGAFAGRQAWLEHRVRSCVAAARLDGAWDDSRRQKVRAAVMASNDPMAGRAAPILIAELDEYAESWRTSSTELCVEVAAAQGAADTLAGARARCLEERRVELATLVDLLTAQPEVAAHALDSTRALAPVGQCRGSALAMWQHPDPVPAARLEKIRAQVARARVLSVSGQSARATDEATQALEQSRAAGATMLEAHALVERGLAEVKSTREGAESDLRDAAFVAAGVHADDVVANAWCGLIQLLGNQPARFADAERWNAWAAQAIARLDGDAALESVRLRAFSMVRERQGRYEESLALAQAALAQAARTPKDDLREAGLRGSIGIALTALGRFDEAHEEYQRARTLYLERVGSANHPWVREIDYNLALADFERGRPKEALTRAQAVLAASERAPKIQWFDLAGTLNLVGWLLIEDHAPSQAIPLLERSQKAYQRSFGPDCTYQLFPLTGLGRAYLALGRPKEALPLLERALGLQSSPAEADSLDRAETEAALAFALWDGGGDRSRARSLAEHARKVLFTRARGERLRRLGRDVDVWLAGR